MPTNEDLWKQWKKDPTKNNLSLVLRQFDNDINKRVNQFSIAEIPKPAMETKAKVLAVEAFKTYNPNKGTSLKTHVYTHLQRLSRYVGDHQNVGKIPENRRFQITNFHIAKKELSEELNRQGSLEEIADRLQWPLKEVERMDSELRNVSISSSRQDFGSDISYFDEKSKKFDDKQRRVIRMVYYELTPEEQTVYEYILGMGGKPRLNETKIAEKLNMSVTRVSNIKHKIMEKIEKWI